MSPNFPNLDLAALSDQIAGRLIEMRRSLRRHFLVEGLAVLAIAVLVAAGLSLLLDWKLELSRTSRLVCELVFAVAALFLVYRRLVWPLTMPLSPLDVAAAIDRSTRDASSSRLAPRVASVLQLPAQIESDPLISTDLIQQAVTQNYRELEHVNFRAHLNAPHWWLSLSVIAFCVLIPAAFVVGSPSVARLWRDRWLLGSNRAWPHSTLIEVQNIRDGRLVVPRGEPAPMQVLVVDSEHPTEAVWMRLTAEDGSEQTLSLNRFAPGDFRYDLPPLQQPMDVEMWGGDGRAEPFRIEPLDRPKMTSLKLTARDPRAGGVQTFEFTGDEGNVRLLPKTDATLEFETNVPLAEVRLESETEGPKKFEQVSDRRFRARWIHGGPVRMRVALVAADSGLESFPRPITIGDKPDRPPTLTMRHSGVRLRVTTRATIPLTLTIRDDFGIRSAELKAQVEAGPRSGTIDSEEPGDPTGAKGPPSTNGPAESTAAPPQEGDAAPADRTPPAAAPAAQPDSADAPAGEGAPPSASPARPTSAVFGPTGPLQFTAVADDESSAATETPADEAGVSEQVFDKTPAQPLPTELQVPLYGPAEPAVETVVEQQQALELSKMDIVPGQAIGILLSAEDDCYTGRQTAASRKLIFRVVKDEELLKEILLRQQQLRSRLTKTYDQMIDLRDKLKTADLSADASNLLRAFLLTRREIGAVARELDASVLELRLNKLGGQESWELIDQTVLKPLARLQEQELERQKQAFETFTGVQPEPLEEVIERQQAIIDGLKKVLDNMSQWDSFIDIINQVNAIIKIQDLVKKRTDELKSKQVDSIFDQ